MCKLKWFNGYMLYFYCDQPGFESRNVNFIKKINIEILYIFTIYKNTYKLKQSGGNIANFLSIQHGFELW